MENKQIQAHNYNLSYLLFAFDYIKLSLRLLQGSCFTQTDVNYCFISFLDDDSCARKTGKNNTYKHNWAELFSNSYSYFNATAFSRIFLTMEWSIRKNSWKQRCLHQNSELGLCSYNFPCLMEGNIMYFLKWFATLWYTLDPSVFTLVSRNGRWMRTCV